MEAQDFVKHIGLTEDFSAHSPEEKVDVIVTLIKYNGNEFQTKGLIWPIIKFGLKLFPIDAIPNKLLDWNYRGEFQFSSTTLKDAQKSFKDAVMSEIEKQKTRIDISGIMDQKLYHYRGEHKEWNIKPKMKGHSLTVELIEAKIGKEEVPDLLTFEITGTRSPSVAKKNLPTFKTVVKLRGEWVNNLYGFVWTFI